MVNTLKVKTSGALYMYLGIFSHGHARHDGGLLFACSPAPYSLTSAHPAAFEVVTYLWQRYNEQNQQGQSDHLG